MSAPDTHTSRILVDGHGGDHAPDMVVDALAALLKKKNHRLRFGIVGIRDVILPALESRGIAEQVEFVPATETIDMCEAPAMAVRRKKDSSMHVGARMVRDGHWDALVSAGNTGALMAISKLILKMLPGIDRPAIASIIPGVNGGRTLLLDCGANVDCTSDHLVQFAVMGSCYMQAAEGIASPRIGLLNIGHEEIKGTDVVKVTAAALRESALNFTGNAEGTDIFHGKFDVVVCDGFVGNVALKAMEGAAGFIRYHLRHELTRNPLTRAGTLFVRSALRRFRAAIDPDAYNGAPLLGLNGVVVKSHGSAGSHAYANAIEVARREVESGLGGMIVDSMNALVAE